MKKILHCLFFLIIIIFYSQSLYAERYALLIGLSQYDNPKLNLSGPINDVLSLQQILIQKRGFTKENIVLLKNNEATKKNIVQQLKKFSKKLDADDYFVFYFSGHGTSRYDPCNKSKAMGYETGALVTYETKKSSALLITKNDLEPYISQMDNKGINGMGLIDACFSGNSYRSYNDKVHFTYRYANFPQLKTANNQCPDNKIVTKTIQQKPYPYKNFVFMTASSANEKALDLDGGLIRYSYDGLVHGAFTNALLDSLKSEQNFTNETFFINIEQKMEAIPSINHSPLLFPQENIAYKNDNHLFPADRLYKNILFSNKIDALANLKSTKIDLPSVNQSADIIIAIAAKYQLLRKTVRESQGLRLKNDSTSELADYLILSDPHHPSQLRLSDVHYIPLFVTYNDSIEQAEQKMAQVLKQQFWLSQFRKSINTLQPFALRISTKKGDNYKYFNLLTDSCKKIIKSNQVSNLLYSNETYLACDILNMTVKPEKKSYLVVLDLTTDGYFSLLYPYAKADQQQVSPKYPFKADNILNEPFGMDSIIAFAFSSEDDPLYQQIKQKWQANNKSFIKPGDSLHQQIVSRFTTADKRHAQHIKNFITVNKQ